MKFYQFIFVALLVASTASAESRFVRFDLPHDISVEVPKNWWLLSDDLKATIEAGSEAAASLIGIDAPSGSKVNLLRANSMPPTYASIAVNAKDSDITADVVMSLSASDLNELEQIMVETTSSLLLTSNLQFLDSLGLDKREISGYPALVFSYRRSGPNGTVIVTMKRLFIGSKEISFNLSYRESEGQIWLPIVEYMKQSFKIEKTR